jgi:hypothetical protein
MSKDSSNVVGNVAIGLAVAVLGFIVYKQFVGSSAVTYTGTAPTAKQTTNAANPAALAAAITAGSGAVSSLASLFNTTSSSAGSLNTYIPTGSDLTGGLDQAYTSTSYNPDEISSDIGQDASAAMAGSGESDVNPWGFSV